MIHGRTALKEIGCEAANLIHVDFSGGGDGVDAQTRVLLLQLGQRVIGGHGLFKCARRTAEFVVKLTHAVERDFSYEEVEILFLEGLSDLGDGLFGEGAVGGT